MNIKKAPAKSEMTLPVLFLNNHKLLVRDYSGAAAVVF